MEDLFDKLRLEPPVEKTNSKRDALDKVATPSTPKSNRERFAVDLSHNDKSPPSLRRESMPSPLSDSSKDSKDDSDLKNRSVSLPPKNSPAVKMVKVCLERIKLPSFVDKDLSQTTTAAKPQKIVKKKTNLTPKQKGDAELKIIKKQTPTKAEQKLFEPAIRDSYKNNSTNCSLNLQFSSPEQSISLNTSEYKIKRFKIRIKRENLKELQRTSFKKNKKNNSKKKSPVKGDEKKKEKKKTPVKRKALNSSSESGISPEKKSKNSEAKNLKEGDDATNSLVTNEREEDPLSTSPNSFSPNNKKSPPKKTPKEKKEKSSPPSSNKKPKSGGFFIKLNTKVDDDTEVKKKFPKTPKLPKSKSSATKKDSVKKAKKIKSLNDSLSNSLTKATKFSRTQLYRDFGKRFFNCIVRIRKSQHPLMLTFESNAKAQKLQARKNKSKNLTVSFNDSVEIIGDDSDLSDSGDESHRKSSTKPLEASTDHGAAAITIMPTRLKKVENGKVTVDIDLDQSLFINPEEISQFSTPLLSSKKHRVKKSYSPLKGDGSSSGAGKDRYKKANEILPPCGLRRMAIDDEDDDDDDEYIVPIELPIRRNSSASVLSAAGKETSTAEPYMQRLEFSQQSEPNQESGSNKESELNQGSEVEENAAIQITPEEKSSNVIGCDAIDDSSTPAEIIRTPKKLYTTEASPVKVHSKTPSPSKLTIPTIIIKAATPIATKTTTVLDEIASENIEKPEKPIGPDEEINENKSDQGSSKTATSENDDKSENTSGGTVESFATANEDSTSNADTSSETRRGEKGDDSTINEGTEVASTDGDHGESNTMTERLNGHNNCEKNKAIDDSDINLTQAKDFEDNVALKNYVETNLDISVIAGENEAHMDGSLEKNKISINIFEKNVVDIIDSKAMEISSNSG